MSNYNLKSVYAYISLLGARRVDNFYLNDRDKEIYKRLFLYFYQNNQFEKLHPSYRLSKGLLVTGDIGVGKSLMMSIFRDLLQEKSPQTNFRMEKAFDIAGEYSQNGYAIIEKHGKNCFGKKNGILDKKQPIIKCYDDLGTEDRLTGFYANKTNVMEKILLTRYDQFIQFKMKTFITTNFTGEQIEEYYGARVRSRLREMVNVINYPGIDRRN
ncbi:P-loop NTPase family protein [Labilibacter marinus]|uniref:hypothetical protein n=1 Tax=Labilibacter marinus TaxID=1477105 RepID=UPI00083312D1|nr:hypothetical protein [Labilibacter marinus]